MTTTKSANKTSKKFGKKKKKKKNKYVNVRRMLLRFGTRTHAYVLLLKTNLCTLRIIPSLLFLQIPDIRNVFLSLFNVIIKGIYLSSTIGITNPPYYLVIITVIHIY